MATASNPYTARMLKLLGEKSYLSVLQGTPEKLQQEFERLRPASLNKSYSPGKWTAAQIFCHLADAEMATGFRTRQIVAEPNHRIQPWDQDVWARNYGRLDAAAAVKGFVAMRNWNFALWRALSPQELARVAFHPERGEESLERILQMLAGHDINHLGQLEQIR